MSHRLAAIGIVALFALMAAGCNASQVTTAPLDTGTPVGTGSSGVADTPGGTVTIDPNLLAILPRSVDSIAVIEDSDGDDQIRADDVLPTIASAAVAAVAADPQNSNLAFGYVIKLLPKALTDAIYRSWRDSFDEGVCQGQDQVIGNASSTVKGNTVYIGTCANGIRTYHAWLESKGILISLWETGEKRLGLVMLGTLRE
jgi:hypothetical protein